MSFLIEKLKFLGLNDREIRVFTAFATFGKMHMSKAASRAGLPRTTVDAIVRRLLEQGLVSKERVGGHYEYFVNSDDVADTLDWIEKRFRPNTGAFFNEYTESGEDSLIKKSDEKIVTTAKNIEILRSLSKEYSGDRVRLLFSKSNEEVSDCTKRLSRYLKISLELSFLLEVMVPAHVADALLYDSTVPVPVPVPERADAVRLNIVPTLYSTALHDMFVFRDSVFLVTVHNGSVEHVTHPTIVDLTKHLVDMASEVGWSVDLGAWLNKLDMEKK